MMKGVNACVCTVLGILGLLLSFSDTTCSPTCLEPPQPGNDTALACNGTESACNDTGLSCNGAQSACNDTGLSCNGTESACNDTGLSCNGTESACNDTGLSCNGTKSACNDTGLSCNGTESVCNDTGLSCNETTLECLYGCREGFGGERCQFRCANNCSNCTVGRCDGNCTAHCDNTTCSQTEACVDSCRDGLFGQNCSLSCPIHCLNSSCGRENGTCLQGCEGEYFGDTCELTCSPNCAKLSDNDTSLICNETTLACLYGCAENFTGDMCDGCARGKTGPQCSKDCDYNCQNCTWDDGKAGCDICMPGFYYFNKRCEQCRSTCFKPCDPVVCDPIDGSCLCGCINAWTGGPCNIGCSPLCVNETCGRHDGCCTKGCRYDTYGGCKCQTPCNSGCEGDTCYQNMTCRRCKLNTWGSDCGQTCNVNCVDAPDITSPTCDRDGNCLYRCKKTFTGRRCSDSCPVNCVENDCDSTSGHCLQGCEKDYWKDLCDTNCSTNCLQSNVTTCYQDNGTCVQGCIVDKHGPFCAQNCPDNCLNKTCHRYNGTCSLGCEKGFTGENCSTQIPPTTDKPGINPTAIAATAGGSGGGLLALIIVALILRHRYIVFKEEAEMKEVNRKTRGGIEDLRKKRNDNRNSRLAVGVFNPGYDKIPRKKSDEEDEAVLAVDTLLDHVMNINIDGFSKEFQKLPANVVKHEKQKKKSSSKGSKKVKFNTTTASNSLTNPIDWDGPVQIENIIIDNLVNESTERTYNASKIEVYSRKYIAAEGPSFSSSVDFWLMAWSTSSPVIVMLTPTSINKQSSSVRYWPINGKEIYGHITITNVREDTFANFVSRELKVEKNGETRVLRQVQLNLWTDDKKFPNIADLIDFYMYFRAITTADPEPVLAHCSDGESRTGVFIALDLLVRDGEKFGFISVLDCVRTLREQRDNMVQNKEHYQFLYSLVAQTLQLRCKPVQEKDFVESFKKSNEALESNPLMTPLEDAYENMRAAIVMKPVDEESIKRQWNLKMKNREGADIPEDQYRPSLPGGLYINAVYIDTLRKKDLITTQMPLPKTVEDFYKLVAAEKCHVIVMLNSTKTMDKTQGVYWPKKGKTVKHGNICASLDDTAKTDDYKQLSLTLSDYSRKACCKRNETEEEHRVTLFQLKHWKTGPRPSNSVSMLRLIRAVKAERGEYEDGPVVVHCLNGSERSGVFCALYELTEAIEKGLAFSVVNTGYKIKYRRPSAILNLDQFKFLHEALEIFITSEEFRGEPVQTAAPMIQADAED